MITFAVWQRSLALVESFSVQYRSLRLSTVTYKPSVGRTESNPVDALLKQLLNALDVVGQSNNEIYDTVCRERMSDPIFHLFISPNANYSVGDDFGLTSPAANAAVKTALLTYCSAANALAIELGINAFHNRLASFQNEDIASDVEQDYFDDFFGWMNPDNFLASGKVVDNPR